MEKCEKIALNYTGGYDSLTAAITLAPRTKELHLLTFIPYGEKFQFLSTRNLEKLKKDFSGTVIIHKVIDNRSLQKRILRDFPQRCMEFGADWAPLGVWCCTCQLAIRTGSLIYCIENGITSCADGSGRDQYFHSSHKVRVINSIKALYGEYGVKFITPIYDLDIDKRDLLKKKGYIVGVDVLGVSKTIQPFCFFGIFGPLRQMASDHRTDEGTIADYVDSKIGELRKMIDEHLKENGIERSSLKKIELSEEDILKGGAQSEQRMPKNKAFIRILFKLASPFYLLFNYFVKSMYIRDKRREKRLSVR